MTSEAVVDDAADKRVTTGIAGLDRILSGGFIAGSIYIIQGSPGAGKTILANQVCFHHAKTGGRAIFTTLLAENHARMLQNLGTLGFFDPARIPDSVRYLSAFAELRDAGLAGLAKLLRREIGRSRATMLVIDGLVSVQASAASDQEFRMFIHDLQEIALATGCTVLLTTIIGAAGSPEHTMVDGLIALGDTLYGWRAERDLQVTKLRGSGFLRGRHSYRITADGIDVYPRLEAVFAASPALDFEPSGSISSGVPDLDAMLDGGLPTGSNTALIGPSGIGKTTLGLQFVAGSTASEPGLFFGFYEQPKALLAKAERLGHPLHALVENGSLEINWQSPTRNPLDAYGQRILEAVERRQVRRLVIDGTGALQSISVDAARVDNFLAALTGELRRRGVTSLFTIELPNLDSPITQLPISDMSRMTENIILLRHSEDGARSYRLLSVLKMRDGNYDPFIRPFAITDRGIVVERDAGGMLMSAKRLGRGDVASDYPNNSSRKGG